MTDWRKSEDWWAVWVGLLIFVLSLGVLAGRDLLGWGVATQEWLDLSRAMAPASGWYPPMPGWVRSPCTN